MTHQFQVGIVGAGDIGKVHANAVAELDSARLAVVAEPREEAGRELAEQHGASWHYSLSDMLQQADVDVVILGTPSGQHPEQTILCAQAGKHVICEKPMAISADGATRMIDVVGEAGVQLAAIFQNRLSRDVYKVYRAIEAGYLGRPVIGNTTMHWYRSQAYYDANGGWRGTWDLNGGGSLINQAIHGVDTLQWLMGDVESVQGHIAIRAHDIETEDTTSASLRFTSAALGTIQSTTSAQQNWPIKVEIVGEYGTAVLENGILTAWTADRPLTDDLLTEADRHLVDGWVPNEPFGAGHRRQLACIFSAIANGTEAPFPGREARKSVDIVLAIYESARTGDRVSFERRH